MELTNAVHRVVHFGRLAAAFAAGALAFASFSAPALAADGDKPEIGSIIISRDFGPRNALIPEVGLRHRIQTAPDPALLAFAGSVTAITDSQAAEISGTFGSLADSGLNIQQALSSVGFGEQMQANGSSGHSASGIGNSVSGAIASGMGALGSVLGALPLGGQ